MNIITFLFNKTPLYFFVQSFWRDEAFTYLLAKQHIINVLITTAKDFNPPFYYLLIHFWMKICGSSEITLRSVSLIFYMLTIYVCYLFLVNIFKFSIKKTYIYLLLFFVNPILIYYACEARMYSMLAFFATSSFYLFFTKKIKAHIIVSVLGIFTHYFMIFPLITQFIYLLFTNKPKQYIKVFKPFIIIFVIFFPWLIFTYFQKGLQISSFWIPYSTFYTLSSIAGILYTGYEL
ncbi:MAG: glycosyltransferase family 39 protein, partial [bacterium]|nr:glycosyltransferase family 39 protein [bacterium]